MPQTTPPTFQIGFVQSGEGTLVLREILREYYPGKNNQKYMKNQENGLQMSYRPLDWTNLHEILRRKRW